MRLIVAATLGACLIVPATSHAGWSGNQVIQELYVHANVVLVRLTSNPNDGCASAQYLTLEPGSDPLFRERYSMLLAAKAAGKEVDVLVIGCGTAQPSHPKVSYVRINEP
jgi:hypothetical protein